MTPEQYARAKELFTAAAQLTDDRRTAFLESHQHEPPEVLQEVRSLLRHHTQQTLLVQTDDTLPKLPAARRPGSVSFSHSTWNTAAPWQLGPRGYLALGIVLTCMTLVGINVLTRLAMQSTLRELRSSSLKSGLDVTVEALQLWIDYEKTRVDMVARDPEMRDQTQRLAQLVAADNAIPQLIASPWQASIRAQLEAEFGDQVKYAIWDRRFVTLADWSPDGTGVGTGVSAYGAAPLTRVFEGQTIIDLPRHNETISKDYPLAPRTPTVLILAPIRDDQQQVVAALLIYGIGADERFNQILGLVRFGRTGETYAFDKTGLMISESRFNADLQTAGLVDPEEGQSSLRVYLRDPGGDLTRGFRPTSPAATWPLTTMARFATAGQDGVDLDGYRDYRGVMVVGAWKWLDEYDFGVATEMDKGELNSAFRYLKLQSAFKLGLLAIALASTLWSYHSLARLRRRVGTDSQLGQYTLEEKIGEGGMGVVYKARHALLKRPTAVKLLKADVANSRTTAWFEREVQLASQLTHPNTIAIYDYGITAEGLFYYAMEYLDGVTLLQVVQQSGPLSVRRTIHILRQIAGSLREAHHLGLVHRDIKPHNVMLCQRAGETDMVKVLDFGLVKELSEQSKASTVLAGTPMYMAPERIGSPDAVDPRMDIYAFGAVGYFLLTGQEIFANEDGRGLLYHVMNTVPPRVTQCVATPIPAELADLIASCLAKDPQDRPANMDAVLQVLDNIALVDR